MGFNQIHKQNQAYAVCDDTDGGYYPIDPGNDLDSAVDGIAAYGQDDDHDDPIRGFEQNLIR
ncbi:hypothetical protein D3C81_1994180 [compost metagenome]